jgi:hypothetical protein
MATHVHEDSGWRKGALGRGLEALRLNASEASAAGLVEQAGEPPDVDLGQVLGRRERLQDGATGDPGDIGLDGLLVAEWIGAAVFEHAKALEQVDETVGGLLDELLHLFVGGWSSGHRAGWPPSDGWKSRRAPWS